jgi:hypothetical protein
MRFGRRGHQDGIVAFEHAALSASVAQELPWGDWFLTALALLDTRAGSPARILQ